MKRFAVRELGRLGGLAFAAGLAALLLFGPVAWPCPLRAMTGLPCPSCGMTRATRLALHGDFAAATHMHPLWFVVAPACAAIVTAEAIAFARTGRWGSVVERRWVLWTMGAIGVALVVVWIARFAGALGGPAPR